MEAEPLVSVVRGKPTQEELAALVAVLSAAAGNTAAPATTAATSAWARSGRPSRIPASWRASGLPR